MIGRDRMEPISSRDAGVSGLCRTVPWNDRRRLKSGDAAETRRSLESDRTRDERVRKLILELLLRFAGSPSAPSIRQILLDVSVRTGLNLFSRSRRCKYAVRRCPRHPRGSRGSRRSRMGYRAETVPVFIVCTPLIRCDLCDRRYIRPKEAFTTWFSDHAWL